MHLTHLLLLLLFSQLTSMSNKPLILYTFWTNNGVKVSTFLEELKGAYSSIDYDLKSIDISKGAQKEPWYLKINPKGKIPVLVDRTRNDYVVPESGAILLYLQQHHDKDNKFGWDPKVNPNEYNEAIQWMFFAYDLGPMQNELQHSRSIPEKIPHVEKRYLDQTNRLYGELEARLSQDRDWLVGSGRGKYSIADMTVLPWVHFSSYSGVGLDGWLNVKQWLERIRSRPASAAGLNIGLP
ncbi:glutathione S-transferase [Rhodocollybia butyracea]|uniref:Glutathione S-transferase n=1 Tax=Rhodocollybia butyracea TaxID=206335 RepID=A0A9P5U428_9AGAR|nr:glutathione S-transferase [Rhodocollybia butyracea]